MKVIGAGLPRTATTTQLVVLEQLGFAPCYHMRNLMTDLSGALPVWERLHRRARSGWRRSSTASSPAATTRPPATTVELAELYPDAKVLLSVRSGESWVRSMRETIWPMYFGDSVMHHVNEARAVIDDEWRRFLDLMVHMTWDERTGAHGRGGHGRRRGARSDDGALERAT